MAATMRKPKRAKMLDADEWGGLLLPDQRPFKHPLEFVVLSLSSESKSCETREECSQVVQDIQKRDMEELGLYNIRYNFLFGGDGNIYVGRGWHIKPAITGVYNLIHGKYLHIACIGNFKGSVRPPLMYKAQWDLLQQGVEKKFLRNDFIFV